MNRSLRVMSAVAAIALLPGVAAAQGRPVELGLDAGFDFKVNDPNVTTIGVPVQDLRVGFGLSDRIMLEPRVSFNYLKVESTDAIWTLGLGGGILFHLNEVRQGIYLRPNATWFNIDAGGASASQFAAGAGIGYKTGSGRVIGRFEAGYSHAFENDDFASSDDVVVLLGFSVFTK